jgi:hypothetical protein
MAIAVLASSFAPAQQPVDLSRLPEPKNFKAFRSSSNNPDWNSNDDSKRPIPGEAVTLADLTGPGVVTHIWLTVAANEYGWPRLLRLRVERDVEPRAGSLRLQEETPRALRHPRAPPSTRATRSRSPTRRPRAASSPGSGCPLRGCNRATLLPCRCRRRRRRGGLSRDATTRALRDLGDEPRGCAGPRRQP